jgi:hypothetical protein
MRSGPRKRSIERVSGEGRALEGRARDRNDLPRRFRGTERFGPDRSDARLQYFV